MPCSLEKVCDNGAVDTAGEGDENTYGISIVLSSIHAYNNFVT
jgi:hypothetical protein